MPSSVQLSRLALGARATVRSFPAGGQAFLRLREMGVLPGVSIRLIRTAPLGDPLEIQVRGYSLSLRRSEADQVLVEPAEES